MLTIKRAAMVILEHIHEEKTDAPIHVLKKILSESLKEAFSKEAVCFLFCCGLFVCFPNRK